jgi:hypothetical protein
MDADSSDVRCPCVLVVRRTNASGVTCGAGEAIRRGGQTSIGAAG